jgi:hypothetical protein
MAAAQYKIGVEMVLAGNFALAARCLSPLA